MVFSALSAILPAFPLLSLQTREWRVPLFDRISLDATKTTLVLRLDCGIFLLKVVGLAYSRLNDWSVREGLGSSFCSSVSIPALGGGLAPSELQCHHPLEQVRLWASRESLRLQNQVKSRLGQIQSRLAAASVEKSSWQGRKLEEGLLGELGSRAVRVQEPRLPSRLSLYGNCVVHEAGEMRVVAPLPAWGFQQ